MDKLSGDSERLGGGEGGAFDPATLAELGAGADLKPDGSSGRDQGAEIESARRQLAGLDVTEGEPQAPREPTPHFRMGAATQAEKKNEDEFTFATDGRMAVIDGVGGGPAGLAAARVAKGAIGMRLAELSWTLDTEVAEKEMLEVMLGADDDVRQAQIESGKDMMAVAAAVRIIRDGASTTAVAGVVGDAQLYLLRDGEERELTEHIKKPGNPEKRQKLGMKGTVSPEVFSVALRPGDRLMVASNGVDKNKEGKKLQKLLRDNEDPQQAAEKVVRKLNKQSRDARTVVILDVPEAEAIAGQQAA